MSDTKVILNNLYPIVERTLKDKSKMTKFKSYISEYISKNSDELYFHSPAYRMYYSSSDKEKIYELFGLDDEKILKLIDGAFYFKIKNYNPRSMKDPLTVLLLNVYRFCNLNNINEEQSLTYLCFSPKLYLSIHSGQFPDFPPSEGEKTMAVMEYTISNLSNKYEIKKKGTLIGSVMAIANNWAKSYDSRIKSWSDEDQCYIFQQLHNRIKQSLIVLCREYYTNLENPKSIILFSSDNYSDENYRVGENNSMMVMAYSNKSVNYILSNEPNLEICKSVSDIIDPVELRNLIKDITSNSSNVPLLNKVVYNMISVYYSDSNAKNKDVRDISFINYSLTRKANSKNKDYLEMINSVRLLLNNNSERYRKNKNKNIESSFVKSLIGYIALIIHISNK